jgi:16S rRNA (uracil1498-N3)-methyltransferase
MTARFHVDLILAPGAELTLPPNASRHVQVLRLQPGAQITLFDGRSGQWLAEVLQMGRKTVSARVLAHQPVDCELACPVTLAPGMPANERMDALVEKATELGVAGIAPLVCERSVLRVAGDRAERKAAHWQAIAVAACEQSGRNRVPPVAPPRTLRDWLADLPPPCPPALRLLLSLSPDAAPLANVLMGQGQGQHPRRNGAITVLSGPEGGLSPAEITLAEGLGFVPVSLGTRVLRADTAPLAALAAISVISALSAQSAPSAPSANSAHSAAPAPDRMP